MIFLKRSILGLAAFSILLLNGCSKGSNPEGSTAVPNVSVYEDVNINNAAYTQLKAVGGVVYLTGVGYRGIMIYRLNSNTIKAYDRTCTYDISDANGIVTAQTNGTAICLECGSTYNLSDGSVNTGPTTIGLKYYNTTFNTITGEVVINN